MSAIMVDLGLIVVLLWGIFLVMLMHVRRHWHDGREGEEQ